MSCIIIRIRNRNDAHCDIVAKSFLKEEASAPRVNIFRNDIDAAHRHKYITTTVCRHKWGNNRRERRRNGRYVMELV